MIKLAERLAPCWQWTRTFLPAKVFLSIVSQRYIRSVPMSVLWSQGMWMYSGSLGVSVALGVVGVLSSGMYSKAVAKLESVAAVSGTGDRSCMTSSNEARAGWNGLATSRATFITTSKLRASSAVGSR